MTKLGNKLRGLGTLALGLMNPDALADIPCIPPIYSHVDTSIPSQEKRRLLRKKRKKHKK